MHIDSTRGRRQAYGSQDLTKDFQQAGSIKSALSVRVLLQPKSGKPFNMQAIADRPLSLADGRIKAALQVFGSIGQSSMPIKSCSAPWVAAKASKPKSVTVRGETPRQAAITQFMRRLQSRFGQSTPNFKSVWENRQKNSADYQLLSKFGIAASHLESVEFLKAVDDYRASPSVEKASKILQVFIEPVQVDDFGIPIDDPSKMQVNLNDDGRKKLILDLKDCIKNAKSDPSKALADVMIKLQPAETYVVDMMKTNLDTVFRAEIKNQTRGEVAKLVSAASPDSFA